MSTSGMLKMDQVDEAAALMVEEAWKHLRLVQQPLDLPLFSTGPL